MPTRFMCTFNSSVDLVKCHSATQGTDRHLPELNTALLILQARLLDGPALGCHTPNCIQHP